MSEESGAFGFGFDDKLVSAPPSFEELMQAGEDDAAETLPPMYTSTVIRIAESMQNEAPARSLEEEEEKHRSPSLNSAAPSDSSSVPDDSERCSQQQPLKKLKYDKLGRLTAVEDVKPVLPLASSLAAANTGNKLKRPRGRPPKGKIWDDKRGWIDEGLGLGPRRKLY